MATWFQKEIRLTAPKRGFHCALRVADSGRVRVRRALHENSLSG